MLSSCQVPGILWRQRESADQLASAADFPGRGKRKLGYNDGDGQLGANSARSKWNCRSPVWAKLPGAGAGRTNGDPQRAPHRKGFQIYVATGQYPNGSGFLQVGHYQASAPFEITAGNSTAVSVTLTTSRVVVLEDVPSAVHSVAGNQTSTLYFINGPDLDQVNGVDPGVPGNAYAYYPSFQASYLPTQKIYGLSWGGDSGLLIDTDQGIYLTGDGIYSLSMGLSPLPVVFNSGIASVTDTSTATTVTISGYSGPGLTAGFDLNDNGWVQDNIGLKGFAATDDYVYISTGLSAVPLTGTQLNWITANSDLSSYLASNPSTALLTNDGTSSVPFPPSQTILLWRLALPGQPKVSMPLPSTLRQGSPSETADWPWWREPKD